MQKEKEENEFRSINSKVSDHDVISNMRKDEDEVIFSEDIEER